MIANCLDEFSTGDDRSSVRRRSGTHGWTRRTRILLLNRGKNIFSYRSIVSRNFENENPIRLFRNYQFKNEEDGTEIHFLRVYRRFMRQHGIFALI